METMTVHEAEVNHPAAAPPAPRRACAATIVAGLYVLMVLGAPLIVRYWPDPEVAGAAAAIAVRKADAARCAAAPEHGRGCVSGDAVTSNKALLPMVR